VLSEFFVTNQDPFGGVVLLVKKRTALVAFGQIFGEITHAGTV
jgi:hypothetical protein